MDVDLPELRQVSAAMDGYGHPWAIAGGWALDLFLGRRSRSHADIDVAVCRGDQVDLRQHLLSFTPRKVVDGQLVDWPVGEWLDLPVHEIHARTADGIGFELLLNECDADWWVFRRDRRIRQALSLAVERAGDLPYLAPEIVLLYKAKSPTSVDEKDFASAARHLRPSARNWLLSALSLCHPGHPWFRALAAEA
jgi:hypothetical protein